MGRFHAANVGGKGGSDNDLLRQNVLSISCMARTSRCLNPETLMC